MRALVLVLALLMVCTAAVPVLANGAKPSQAPTVTQEEQTPSVNEQVTPPPAPPGSGPTEVTTTTTTTLSTTDEQLINRCLISTGLTSQQISQFRAQGLSYSDIAIAQAIAARTNCPITQVISQFQTSKDWNQVAKNYNLTLTDLTSMPIVASADVESFNQTFISQYYNVPQADIARLRQQGYSWDQINMMANAAARTNQPIQQIADLRSQGMSWSDIATRYNVASSTLTSPMSMRTISTAGVYGAGATGACPTPTPTVCDICGAGPNPVTPVMYGYNGNVLLTQDQVRTFYSKGYDWLDVAIAANVSRYSGVPMDILLQEVRAGGIWDNVVAKYGVPPDVAFNVCAFPFERRSIYSSSMEQKRLDRIQRYQMNPGSLPVNPMPNAFMPVQPNITTPR